MLIQGADLNGARQDIRISGGAIADIAPSLAPLPGEPLHPAHGGAALPGLHDHHIHLNAAAAALASIPCGPPAIRSAAALMTALHAAPGTSWLRGINYHPAVAGELDRAWLDRHGPARPIRIQHRSGRLWMFNSAALDLLGPGAPADGRLLDNDGWLAARLASAPPDLAPLSAQLAARGITGVTDATARNGATDLAHYAQAGLRQTVLLMGDETLPPPAPLKLHFHEDALPDLPDLTARIAVAHAAGRPIAVHCVTRAELFLTLAALDNAGVHPNDRLEHAAVTPPEALDWIARLNLRVVTQPHFLAERQDTYRADVPSHDHAWLYRLAGFLRAGVRLAAGSDAPLGDHSPWRAMHAATHRPPGFGGNEALTPEQALALYLAPLTDPGTAPRTLQTGAPADLCILDRPWHEARENLASVGVRLTLYRGMVTHQS